MIVSAGGTVMDNVYLVNKYRDILIIDNYKN
jgi:hypothetical protein